MSERGAYLTQFIYCDRCFNAVQKFLKDRGLGPINLYGQSTRGVLAGQARSTYSSGELDEFESIYLDKILQPKLCHPVSVLVWAESDRLQIFHFEPMPGETYDPSLS
jgi:hypothetical protein